MFRHCVKPRLGGFDGAHCGIEMVYYEFIECLAIGKVFFVQNRNVLVDYGFIGFCCFELECGLCDRILDFG